MLSSLKDSFGLLLSPDLRWYLLGPLLVNVVLFFSLGIYIFSWIPELISTANGYLPEWLAWLSWLVAPLVIMAVVVVGVSTFNIVGNIIAAPLNAFLSEKTERLLMGDDYIEADERSLSAEVVHAVLREFRKLGYFLPRFLLVLIISFIPGVQIVAPIIWFLFGAWYMAFQYFDYPLDNRRFNFSDSKKWIKARKAKGLVFGGSTSFLFMVPGLNLFMMPLCVVWATKIWVDEQTIAS
jgi:CysZ protein